MDINVHVEDVVYRADNIVYEAIVKSNKITKYFTTRTSGDLVKGEEIIWNFDDVGVTLKIRVLKMDENKSISFSWKASGQPAIVEILIKAEKSNKCTIQILEGPFRKTDEGIQRVLEQTQGWTDFICSLKAYLYTGINLRSGELSDNN